MSDTSLFSIKQGSDDLVNCTTETVVAGNINTVVNWADFPGDTVIAQLSGLFEPVTTGSNLICTVRVRIGGTSGDSDDPVGDIAFELDVSEATLVNNEGLAITKPADPSYVKLTVERKSGGTGVDDKIQVTNAVVTLKPATGFRRDQGLFLTDRPIHTTTTWGAVVTQWIVDFDSIDSTEITFSVGARTHSPTDFSFGFIRVALGGPYNSETHDEILVNLDISWPKGVDYLNSGSAYFTKPEGKKLLKVIIYTADAKPVSIQDTALLIIEGGSVPPPPEF